MTNTRCGMIALVGAPNAGKSTLLNKLIGTKVSIVTHKPQTTRSRVRGLAIVEDTQLIFIDTPGIFKATDKMDRAMVAAAWDAALDADDIIFIVDAQRGVNGRVTEIVEKLKSLNKKAVLVLNKIDAIRREELLTLTDTLFATGIITDVFMISAQTGEGVEDFKNFVAGRAPESPWLFPEDQLTDVTERFLAAEITREKLFKRVHKEIPYDLMVVTDSWEHFRNGSVKINQTIYLERESQRKIILGAQGAQIKAIGEAARKDIAVLIDAPVHLFLHVKIKKGWREQQSSYQELGLDFKK